MRYQDIDKKPTVVAEGSAGSSKSVVIKGKLFLPVCHIVSKLIKSANESIHNPKTLP